MVTDCESEVSGMDDLISRKGTAAWLEHMGYPGLANAVMDEKRFPSKLGTNLAEVGTDTISRQAVKELAHNQVREKYCGMAFKEQRDFYIKLADSIIDLLPPAQPEIIRCKNCKHWIPYDWMFSEVWQSKNIADYPEDEMGCDCCDMAMKANDFCSRGERRTDE